MKKPIFLKQVLVTEAELQQKIKELGEQITSDYKDSHKLVLVCILRGGVMFLTDLIREIDLPHSVEFMAISSYVVGNRESTGQVRINLDLNINIEGKDILIVEDIIDSGRTLASVMDLLSARRPNSIEVCALLDKTERREVQVPVRYTGFSIPNEYVFGYGLDLDELYRNLPYVGVVDEEKYQDYRSKHPELYESIA